MEQQKGGPKALIQAMVDLMRPEQWLKNLLILAGFFFALADRFQSLSVARSFGRSVLAMVLFCGLASAVYILNDLHDIPADRVHPVKRRRPLASGRISIRWACVEAVVLWTVAWMGAWWIGRLFALCLLAYFLMQCAYTLFLKNIVLVDVFVVALGFVIRVYAGTLAAGVRVSSWLLVCTFMVSLFLILSKRYNEKVTLGDRAGEHRKVLAELPPAFLGHLMAIAATSTILCYALYTLASETIEKFGTERLAATVPFVVFGLFRYMFLVFCRGEGGRPERTLVQDWPLVANFVCYVIACVLVMMLK